MKAFQKFFCLIAILFIMMGAASLAAQAQTPQEELAKQIISQNTGIDPNLLATLFVTDNSDQFILAFVYINEAVLNSNLKPNLKDAIRPYVGKRAVLTLVLPTRDSAFSPLELTFSQNDVTGLITTDQIHAISDDFMSGKVKTNVTSAGIIELPQFINIDKSFTIIYRGKFNAPFSISGVVDQPASSSGPSNPGASGFLLFILQIILLLFLIPFLII